MVEISRTELYNKVRDAKYFINFRTDINYSIHSRLTEVFLNELKFIMKFIEIKNEF